MAQRVGHVPKELRNHEQAIPRHHWEPGTTNESRSIEGSVGSLSEVATATKNQDSVTPQKLEVQDQVAEERGLPRPMVYNLAFRALLKDMGRV